MGRGKGTSRAVLLGKQKITGPKDSLVENPGELLEALRAEDPDFWERFKESLNPEYSKPLEFSPFIRTLFKEFEPSKYTLNTSAYYDAFAQSIKNYLEEGIPVFFDAPILDFNNISYPDRQITNPVINSENLSNYFKDLIYRQKDFNKFFKEVYPNYAYLVIKSYADKSGAAVRSIYFTTPIAYSLTTNKVKVLIGDKRVQPIFCLLDKLYLSLPKGNHKSLIYSTIESSYRLLANKLNSISQAGIKSGRSDALTAETTLEAYEEILRFSVAKIFQAIYDKGDTVAEGLSGFQSLLPSEDRSLFLKKLKQANLNNFNSRLYITHVVSAFVGENHLESEPKGFLRRAIFDIDS